MLLRNYVLLYVTIDFHLYYHIPLFLFLGRSCFIATQTNIASRLISFLSDYFFRKLFLPSVSLSPSVLPCFQIPKTKLRNTRHDECGLGNEPRLRFLINLRKPCSFLFVVVVFLRENTSDFRAQLEGR